jgi:ABC-type bacteriocin/lantibiotic exporter with double-glycine peptidase domain
MKYLCQTSPEWAGVKIGNTKQTVGRIGCAISCVSMISDYFGEYKSPKEIAQKGHFTTDGRLYWDSISKLFKKFKFVSRTGKNMAKIKQAIVDPNQAVMIQVNNGSHWMTCVHAETYASDFLCVDPINGKVRSALGDYRNITGAAFFTKA